MFTQSTDQVTPIAQAATNAVRVSLPFYASRAAAGFPSPADDHIESRLDPTALLIKRPAATFFVRASGDSMVNAGIHDGDLLVVDRSITAQAGDIVIATCDDGLTVKRLEKVEKAWVLMPANPAFRAIAIDPEQGVYIWGVVTFSITAHCNR